MDKEKNEFLWKWYAMHVDECKCNGMDAVRCHVSFLVHKFKGQR